MKRMIFALVFMLMGINVVSAAMNPYPPFCEHQGYLYNLTDDRCYFGDGNSCNMMEFYNGTCGSEYVREFPCVKLGEHVFHFEECCEGESYIRPLMVGQPTCQIISPEQKFYDQIEANFGFLFPYIPIFIVAVIGIVIYLKKRK